MITVQIEDYEACLEEMQAIYPDHYEALALNKDKVPLDPDYDIYLAMNEVGKILCATLRDDKREMMGYFIGLVNPGLHYKTCLTLTMDIFWVCPAARGQWVGVKLFRCVEEEAKRLGVQRVFYGSKVHQDASMLFKRLGCEEVETSYTKWIGD